MSDFENKLKSFSATIQNVDLKLMQDVFDAYNKIPKKDRNFRELLKKLEKKEPHIFVADERMNKVPYEEEIDWSLLEKNIQVALKDKKIQEIIKKIKKLFLAKHYEFSKRVKNRERLLENIKINSAWAKTDMVGLRVVPKSSHLFPDMIRKFEKEFGSTIAFKLNLFLKGDKETNRTRTSSVYYNAINYYFPIKPFFMEVQMRTPAIDLWSDITHDTIYKRKIKISPLMERYINKFGEMCNVVDFFEIIQS